MSQLLRRIPPVMFRRMNSAKPRCFLRKQEAGRRRVISRDHGLCPWGSIRFNYFATKLHYGIIPLLMVSHCNSKTLLRKVGVEYTLYRSSVLEVLRCHGKALTPQMILAKIRKRHAIDKVTLYRILDLFVAKKLLRRLSSNQGPLRYEIICEKHNPLHPHFVCRLCGEMECLHNVDLKNVQGQIRSKLINVYEGEEIDIKFEGLCVPCREQQ